MGLSARKEEVLALATDPGLTGLRRACRPDSWICYRPLHLHLVLVCFSRERRVAEIVDSHLGKEWK